ncbi:MAG: hypothetical protein ACRD43_03255 [Pyrinomonadaceae bacterium]
MFDRFYDIIDYVFPVYIIQRNDTLSIEDRRPTYNTFASGLCVLLFGLGAAITFFFAGLREAAYWIGPAAAWLVSLLFAIKGTFREIYVFDKPSDTYVLTRQNVFGKDVIQGNLSQIGAVRFEGSDSDDDNPYDIALLMQGMLLGQPDTQILRENPPAFNNYEIEERIADAISSFLNIKREDEDTVAPKSDDESLITLGLD